MEADLMSLARKVRKVGGHMSTFGAIAPDDAPFEDVTNISEIPFSSLTKRYTIQKKDI